jgi:hypothetical protein
MTGAFKLSKDYWHSVQVSQKDVENLHTHLFERETPLTVRELVSQFIESRIEAERQAAASKQKSVGRNYLPKETYSLGEDLVFPALSWARGTVKAVRAGSNQSVGEFDVLTVEMEDQSERMFAARLEAHLLNDMPIVVPQNDDLNPELI